MWWLAFLLYLAAAAFAPKAVGYASLLLIALWVIWRIAKIFSLPKQEADSGDEAASPIVHPAAGSASAVHVPTAPMQIQPVDPSGGLHESDEEFLARQRAANFQHDPSHG